MKKTKLASSLVRILFGVMMGCFMFGQVCRLALTHTLTVPYFEIAVIIFVGFTVLLNVQSFIQEVKTSMILRSLLPFAGMIVLSLSIAQGHLPWKGFETGVLYAIRFLLYAALFVSIKIHLQNKDLKKTHVLHAIALAGSCVALFGLLQYFLLPDTRFLLYMGWDDHYFRLISTLLDPPFTAAVIALPILFLNTKKLTVWTGTALVVLLVAFLLTYSRASYVSLAIALVIQAIFKRKLLMLVPLALLLIGIPFLPRVASEGTRLERTASISARELSFTQNLSAFSLQTWVTGNGWYVTHYNRQPQNGIEVSHSSAPDNSYLHILESVGIPGLLCFFFFIGKTTLRSKKDVLFLSFLGYIMIGSLFNNLFFYPWVMALFWMLLASADITAGS